MPMHGGHLWHKHKAVRSGDQLTVGERASDALKMAFGTWTLLGLIIAGLVAYLMLVRDPGELRLNLALSCMAAVQGIILQISANRGDRISAEVALHTQGNTDELMAVNARQLEILTRMDGLDGKVSDLASVMQQVLASRAEHDAAVAADARAAKTAAESAFVAAQTLAATATAKPGLPEVVKAVSAHTDALRAMEQTVRTATGPQPALPDVAAEPAPVVPVKGMGARVPPKTPGKM